MGALLLIDFAEVLFDLVSRLNVLVGKDLPHSFLFFLLLLQPDLGRVERQSLKLLILRDVHWLSLSLQVAVAAVDRRVLQVLPRGRAWDVLRMSLRVGLVC